MDKEKAEVISIVKEFKEKIKNKIKLEKLIFFGSRAKGTAKKKSDIDILVISKAFRGKKYFKRAPLFYLLWDYKYDVDILCLTPEEVAEKKKQIGIIHQALKEGIVI